MERFPCLATVRPAPAATTRPGAGHRTVDVVLIGLPGSGKSAVGRRLAARQARSVPLLAKLDAVRQPLAAQVLPKAPLGDALRYLDRQWRALQRFTDDGRLLIDNNNAERQLRTVAVGRRNWLFAGSLQGAHRAALLYSLIQSCRLADVAPFPYLRDVLIRVATHPHQLIHQLTPKGWAATFGPTAAP